MADYQKMYHTMFNAATDALEHLHLGSVIEAEYILKNAQLQCEELYIETEPDITVAGESKIIEINTKDRS